MHHSDTPILSRPAAPSETVYLRPGVKLEPLVAGWYAWPHLLAPATLAMNLAFRYRPLLQSYLDDPAAHIAAACDPSLFGGPFVALPQESLPDVRRLLDEIDSNPEGLLRLGLALKALDGLLQERAQGERLDGLYEMVPPQLGGFVEFVYDLNHHPRIRLQEELLGLRGPDVGALQHFAVHDVRDEQRPFFLSTPRLGAFAGLNLRRRFDDQMIDVLARARTVGATRRDVATALDLSLDAVERFVTTAAPRRADPEFAGEEVRVRYFGHACVLLQSRNESILIDPLVTCDHGDDNRFTLADLPDRLDYVVLSHGHGDHACPETLLQIRHKVGCVLLPRSNAGAIADPSLKLMLSRLGYRDVRVVDPFDEVPLSHGRLVSLPFPGEHGDLDIYARHGLMVELSGRRFMFLVDSSAVDPLLYRRLADIVGAPDALFIGMACDGAPLSWLYGPLMHRPVDRRHDDSRRLIGSDFIQASRVIRELRPAQVFVYAMGLEPWLRYLMGKEQDSDSHQLAEVRRLLQEPRFESLQPELLNGCQEMYYL
jgi:L-ascorbate metabolism protein UlaG (beta-lactamase superfamily)